MKLPTPQFSRALGLALAVSLGSAMPTASHASSPCAQTFEQSFQRAALIDQASAEAYLATVRSRSDLSRTLFKIATIAHYSKSFIPLFLEKVSLVQQIDFWEKKLKITFDTAFELPADPHNISRPMTAFRILLAMEKTVVRQTELSDFEQVELFVVLARAANFWVGGFKAIREDTIDGLTVFSGEESYVDGKHYPVFVFDYRGNTYFGRAKDASNVNLAELTLFSSRSSQPTPVESAK